MDLDKTDELVELAQVLSHRRKLIGAYSQNEFGLFAAARINEVLASTCRFNPSSTVQAARDKGRFREINGFGALACRTDNPWQICSTHRELSEFLTQSDWPEGLIVKPRCGVASMGVKRVRNAEDIASIEIPGEGLLAELFVRGTQFSVETFSFNGTHRLICINQEALSECGASNEFVNVGHMLPMNLGRELNERLFDSAKTALDAIGLIHGPCHTEMIVSNGEVFIIEMNTRPAGSPIPEMIFASTGFDLYSLCVDWFLGRDVEPRIELHANGGAAVRHFMPPPGRLLAVHGLEQAQSVKGVSRVMLQVSPGQIIPTLESGFERAGYVTAVGDSPESAYASCCLAVSLVQFEVDPHSA